jgi:hypothetical protein
MTSALHYSMFFIRFKFSIFQLTKTYFRIGCKAFNFVVRGQGGKQIKSGAYTIVREHFELFCNTAIGQKG